MRLMQGDCLEKMKEIDDGSVDMILTDPPYGMSYKSNHRAIKYQQMAGDDDVTPFIDELAEECFRIAKNNTAHYIFCSYHNIDKFKQAFEKHFKIKNILVWEKNNTSMGDLKGDFAPKVEFIIFMHKGRSLIRGRRDSNVLKFNRTGNKNHPTEKPVDMFKYMIGKFSDPGDVVLDCFMGSGTTGVACVKTGREFIGIELNETYFKTASNRINETMGA